MREAGERAELALQAVERVGTRRAQRLQRDDAPEAAIEGTVDESCAPAADKAAQLVAVGERDLRREIVPLFPCECHVLRTLAHSARF